MSLSMKRNLRTALNQMKKLYVEDIEGNSIGKAPIFETYSDGSYDVYEGRISSFGLSAEEPHSYKWLNYYGEYEGYGSCDGCPWIHQKLENIADNNNCIIEWHDGGSARVYPW